MLASARELISYEATGVFSGRSSFSLLHSANSACELISCAAAPKASPRLPDAVAYKTTDTTRLPKHHPHRPCCLARIHPEEVNTRREVTELKPFI